MGLIQTIKKDLATALKAQDEDRKQALRIILGELGRLDDKHPSDEEIVKVIKKLAKAEKETLRHQGQSGRSKYLEIIENYLPAMASEAEIKDWIQTNIDFSNYKNKMQAMREIMQHFKSNADGNLVKSVLENF